MLRQFAPLYSRYIPATPWTVLFGNLQPLLIWWALGAYTLTRLSSRHGLLDVTAVGAFGYVVAAFLQWKGFSYHYYAGMACAAVLMSTILSVPPGRRPVVQAAGNVAAATGLVIWTLLFIAPVADRVGGEASSGKAHVVAVTRFAAEHGHHGILVLSPRIADAFPPMLGDDARWASRHPFMWFVPSLYDPQLRRKEPFDLRQGSEVGVMERQLMRSVGEDLARVRPQHLLVVQTDSAAAGLSLRMDYLGFFARDSVFAREFRSYRQVGSFSDFDVYRRQ
jgi:hypothetical protein